MDLTDSGMIRKFKYNWRAAIKGSGRRRNLVYIPCYNINCYARRFSLQRTSRR